MSAPLASAEDSSGVKFPPPIIFLVGLAIGLATSWFVPVRVIPATVVVPLGVSLLIVWLALWVPALASFSRAKTPLNPTKPSTALVTSGVFRISRNPIYLGMVALYLAIAVLANSLWALLLIIPVFLVINFAVVAREEQYLERKFGAEYTGYKQHVRRWL
jgi:protein-S-isoprenylcysteine O-methyltransferase Ste14